MLFDRSLASFINNIIYIDRPNNYKIWLEVVCTIFCFLKMTSFHTPHNNFKTLLLPSRSIAVFRRVFLLLFLRDPWAGNRHRRIPAVPHIKLKFIEHAQQNARLLVRDYSWPHPYVSVCDVAQTPNFRLSKTNNKTKNLGNVKFYRGRSPLLMIGPWQGWLFEIWI